jgi:hypothetical protein
MSKHREYTQEVSTPTPISLGREPAGIAPPTAAVKAVIGTRRAALAAIDRAAPIDLVMWNMCVGLVSTKILGALARLRVADLLVKEGPLTGEAIAAKTGQHADAMHRSMRAMVAMGVFSLDREGRFANNFRSEALRSDRPGAMREFVEYFATRSNVDAWNEFDEVLRTGKSGFEAAHGIGVWDFFDAHPGERDLFASAMMGMTTQLAPVIAGLYPWNEVKVLCDVAGGRGTLLSELLVRTPGLRGMLYDGAGVIELAKELLSARGVLDRVELASGSFFEHVPPGADAYSLKNVLHDWDDARSITILKNVRSAMKPGQKVLVIETIVEKLDTSPGALADVQMMVVCDDGRERSKSDYGALFAASGFTLGRVFEHALTCVIEGVAS